MADRDYNLNYRADATGFLGPSNIVIRILRLIDQIIDRLIPKMARMYSGMSRSAGTATTRNQALAAALNAVSTQTGAAATNAQSLQAALGRVGRGGTSAAGGLGRLSAQYLALAAGTEIINSLAEGLEKARDFANEAAEANNRLALALREVASIKGEAGPGKGDVSDTIKAILATGASSAEHVEFETSWQQAIPAAKKARDVAGALNWQLSPDQEKILKEKVEAFGIQRNIAPKALADMAAQIGIFEQVKSVDQFMAKMDILTQMGNEAIGAPAKVFESAGKIKGMFVRPEGGGPVRSSEELMAHMAAASTQTGSSTDLAARGMRLIVQSMHSDAGMALGMHKMTFMGALDAFGTMFAEGKAAGKDELEVLKEKGFKLKGAEVPIIANTRIRELHRANLEASRRAGDPQAQARAFEQWKASPAGMFKFGESAKEAAKLQRGEEFAELGPLRLAAEAGMTARAMTQTGISGMAEQLTDFKDPFFNFSPAKVIGLAPASEARQDELIARVIQDMAPDLLKATPTGAMGGLPVGRELAGVIRSLPADQQAELSRRMSQFRSTTGPVAGVPADAGDLGRSLLRRAGQMLPGPLPNMNLLGPNGLGILPSIGNPSTVLPAPAPGPPLGVPGPGAMNAPEKLDRLVAVNERQLGVMEGILRKGSGGAVGGVAVPTADLAMDRSGAAFVRT